MPSLPPIIQTGLGGGLDGLPSVWGLFKTALGPLGLCSWQRGSRVRSIRASHVVLIEIVNYQGQTIPYDNRDAKNAMVAIEGDFFVIRGGGLDESIPLADVE